MLTKRKVNNINNVIKTQSILPQLNKARSTISAGSLKEVK
jgi:hypothetical protein